MSQEIPTRKCSCTKTSFLFLLLLICLLPPPQPPPQVVRYFLTMIEPWHFHAPSKLTVVQTAAKHNELAIMQALLAHGFLDHETNGEGETALHLAARNGSLDVAKVLCRHAMESESKSEDGKDACLAWKSSSSSVCKRGLAAT